MSNNNIVLVTGEANTGKSTSLMFFDHPEKIVYLNTDKKDLPFNAKFKKDIKLSHPDKIINYIQQIEKQEDVTGVILDTVTFLMQMYERMCVRTAADGRSAWGDYHAFYGDFIDAIKSGTKDYAVMAHEEREYHEETMSFKSTVPVKGALKKMGIAADFTTIVCARKVPIKILEEFPNDLLHITDEEREDGEKYVFMTRSYKGDGDLARSKIKLWSRKELYIDNNIQHVFTRLRKYYNN